MRFRILVCTAGFLAAVALWSLVVEKTFADEGDTDVPQRGEAPGSECGGPPQGAQPVPYRILFSQVEAAAGALVPPPPTGSKRTFSVYDRQQIVSEEQYQRVFGEHSNDIDWNKSRIVVVQLSTAYKLGNLESEMTLAGIFQTAGTISIGLTFTQYGPCQGTAQLPEWFSYQQTDLIVLLPAAPSDISFYSCEVGGCPPNIP